MLEIVCRTDIYRESTRIPNDFGEISDNILLTGELFVVILGHYLRAGCDNLAFLTKFLADLLAVLIIHI